MTPVSPVIPGTPLDRELVIAKDQPEYIPLPALICLDGKVVTRWRATLGERLRFLFGGNLYLSQLTFGDRLQPLRPSVERPRAEDLVL